MLTWEPNDRVNPSGWTARVNDSLILHVERGDYASGTVYDASLVDETGGLHLGCWESLAQARRACAEDGPRLLRAAADAIEKEALMR